MTEYDGAAHIFNWARNSASHYARMREIFLGNFLREGGKAMAAANLAYSAWSVAVTLGDMQQEDVSAADILRAAIMFLEWDGES